MIGPIRYSSIGFCVDCSRFVWLCLYLGLSIAIFDNFLRDRLNCLCVRGQFIFLWIVSIFFVSSLISCCWLGRFLKKNIDLFEDFFCFSSWFVLVRLFIFVVALFFFSYFFCNLIHLCVFRNHIIVICSNLWWSFSYGCR